MHFYIPEIIFSLFFLSGTPPRVAAIASDVIVWPIYVTIDRARSYPCVVRLDKVIVFDKEHPAGHITHSDRLVDGPPSPFKKRPGPLHEGFDTWNCWTAADPGQFSWWTRGNTMPSPPWQTAWCVLHHFCNSANFFVVRDYESAIIPWP